MIMKLLLFASLVSAAAAFAPGRTPLNGVSTGGTRMRMSTPPSTPGGWENDDFLNSLGGGGGENYDPNAEGINWDGEPVERIVPPENDMTDEEITMMAVRAAQFYNTDTSLEEAYGTQRQGPPRKQEEEGGGEDWQ